MSAIASTSTHDSQQGLKERFLKQWKTFRDDKPGERFLNLYERRRESRGGAFSWGRLAIVGGGIALILAGLFFLAAPGPGTLVLIAGLGLVASESKILAKGLDWAEVKVRPYAERALKIWHSLQPATKGLVIGTCILAAIGGGYAFYQWQLQQTSW